MIEGSPRAGETAAGQRLDALLDWRWRLPFVFQGQHQNALEASHVDEVETQRSGTRGIQSFRRVALGQPQQPLALAQLGPRKGCIQQALGELTDLRPKCHGLPAEASCAPQSAAAPLR